jgi:hypothetical protein
MQKPKSQFPSLSEKAKCDNPRYPLPQNPSAKGVTHQTTLFLGFLEFPNKKQIQPPSPSQEHHPVG